MTLEIEIGAEEGTPTDADLALVAGYDLRPTSPVIMVNCQ